MKSLRLSPWLSPAAPAMNRGMRWAEQPVNALEILNQLSATLARVAAHTSVEGICVLRGRRLWLPRRPIKLPMFAESSEYPRMMLRKACGIKRAVLIGLATVGLSGCGFHLQGAGALPEGMGSTYIEADDRNSEFFRAVREALRRNGSRVVSSPEGADAVLSILNDGTGRRVMSVTARNVPREYEVFYSVTFAFSLGERKLIEPQTLAASRVYAWNETKVLGKSAEEEVLRKALAEDLARRAVRQIEAHAGDMAVRTSARS